ncbi:MAG: YceI family protein [Gammaproteobacteria bacterium]|nr:YceI family protein [Gammaproteobacteria bacterium]NND40167.1 YceI family protein [Pseudomonadales bacterium]MBT8151676.1 YceI family protein [Gammaproteobacteria bacterium]NNL10721.1 YceI family protein [Pseudomonadales bacterium]NNM12624.1 YceI family protein [Pseudomonadales bacterium]
MRCVISLISVLFLLQGCSGDVGGESSDTPKQGNSQAAGSQSAPANAVQASIADAAAGIYALDKTHGYVTFSYSHQGYSRPWLRFRDVDATLTLNPDQVSLSKLDVNIDAASIDSGVDIFDEHLRGEKFFNVAKHPKIEYVANSVSEAGSAGNFRVEGILTMKGVAKPLALDVRFNKSGTHFSLKKPQVGFSATASLKRSDWDLGYAVPMVGDAVDVVIEAEFIQP